MHIIKHHMIGISFSQYDTFIHLTPQWNVLNILLYYSLKKEECVRLFKPVGFFSVTGHDVFFVDTSIYFFHYCLYFLFIMYKARSILILREYTFFRFCFHCVPRSLRCFEGLVFSSNLAYC
jgi:hypothetical protein